MRAIQTLSQDLSRVINRVKALYRGWGIACAGPRLHAFCYREEWLQKVEYMGEVRDGTSDVSTEESQPFRRVASSVHVSLIDKRDQSTKVNPGRSDGSGVLCPTIGVLLNLGNRIGDTR